MKEYVLKDASEGRIGNTPAWRFIMTKPDGTHHGHIMPTHTLDARAIEYDWKKEHKKLDI